MAKQNPKENPDMLFGKQNYMFMLLGIILIIVGFIILSGGGSDDPNVFNYEMFNTRRLVIAPLLILVGLGIEVYAIMKRPKKTE